METFRCLKLEDGKYILKNQTLLNLVIGCAWLVFGVWACVYDTSNKASVVIGILIILTSILVFVRANSKIIFDPVLRVVTFPKLRNRIGLVVPFDQFLNFKMVKIKQQPLGLVTNNWLQMEFSINGKSKSFQIRQYGPRGKNAQQLIDEIELVMKINKKEPLAN